MPDTLEDVKGYREVPERRSHPRHGVRSLAYIELDEGNGGILLNVSESGLAVQAVTPLIDEFLPHMRLQLSQTAAPIAAVGQIMWTANSRKVAGIRFLDFPPEAASQVKEWIASEDFPLASPRETNFPRENPDTLGVSPISPTEVARHQASDTVEETEDHSSTLVAASEPALVDEDVRTPEPASSLASVASPHQLRIVADFKKDATPKTEAVPEIILPAHGEMTPSSWLLYTLIGILAVCSMAAGWSVGRTGFYGAIARFRAPHSDTAAPDAAPSPQTAIANLPGIEIVDLNNRRWFVPFAGPAANVYIAPRTQPVAGPPPARQKAQASDRVMTPESSVRPSVARPRVADVDVPPTISNQPAGNAGSGAPLAAISGSANPLAPLPPGQNSPSAVVEAAQLVHRVDPIYPNNAIQLYSTDATIKMHVTIGADGLVQSVTPVSGPPLFFQAATNAIRQWRYRPALINGKPSVSDGEISMVFRHP